MISEGNRFDQITSLSLRTRKDKPEQTVYRSNATERGVESGSTLFATPPAIYPKLSSEQPEPLMNPPNVLCILRQRGVQLRLAYSWARSAILVAGKGRGGGGGGLFLFLLFLHFYSCSSFFPLSLSFISSTISFLPFSGRRHKITHKG